MVATTLSRILRERAQATPDQRVYTFIEDGDTRDVHCTHAQLDHRARVIGAHLQALRDGRQRALLLYPPGMDYIAGFFGCLYAGVVAVPAYPPNPAQLERTLPRLQAIIADAQTGMVLTTSGLLAMARGMFARLPGLEDLHWVATDKLDDAIANNWRESAANERDLAFLQYTSGSTDTPKGVMLSHANLLANSRNIQQCFGHSTTSQGVIWLPPYHDMGLIGGIIQPLYVGFPVALMSPLHFLQRPMRWLRAVSRFRATTSGGPNFAYELCVRKSTEEERAALDLSTWDLAFNGAEPIRSGTLERFAAAFAPAGFRPQAFYPCYGLAEATLIVSGGDKGAAPFVQTVDPLALADGRSQAVGPPDAGRELVACGHAVAGQEIVIVAPETRVRLQVGEVGEIWVTGPSVARGYWQRPQDTEDTFQASLAGTGPGAQQRYLRTGDLGYLDQDGQLFVTGRLKDLLIVHGRNHYPHDIEHTVERCHPGLRPGCGAAFAIDGDARADHREQLIIVHEFDRRKFAEVALSEVVDAIRAAVPRAHDIQPDAIVLIAPRTIPKTSSGKIQRRTCRAAYLADGLQVLTNWNAPPRPAPRAPGPGERPEYAVGRWLLQRLARELQVSEAHIDPRVPLAELGLGSVQAVALTGELEDWLGRRLSPTLVYQYPTIDALARHLGHNAPEVQAGPSVALAPTASASQATGSQAIAIVGIGCRFPGAANPDAFWQLLCAGTDAITEVSSAREQMCGRPFDRARWGGFLSDDIADGSGIAGFDPDFFGINRREARAMDPQQRLLLEVAWEALEDAGQAADRLRGSATGVFVGISTDDYSRIPTGRRDGVYHGTSNARSIAANRLSYALDLRGPSLAVDSACSSSLVAVHLACESLRSGSSALALAGGVNLMLSSALTEVLHRAGFLSPTGRCKTFSENADGYVRGEGAGVVVLKPAEQALADGDHIYALIRGSAVNSDGRSNGLTAPNGQAQEAVLRAAYRHAGVSPSAVGYVETHGTGTALGDPIEVAALANVVSAKRASDSPCLLGAVKSNIGHLEAAAGIAGLIKAALALSHGQIPPNVHSDPPNPLLHLQESHFRVPRALEPWPGGDATTALAGVSSFGFGGTNAHVVLERAPQREWSSSSERAAVLLPLSAHQQGALRELAGAVAAHLRHSDASLVEIAGYLAHRRSHLDHRLTVLVSDRERASDALLAFAGGQTPADVMTGQRGPGPRPSVVFVFSGQGAQWPGMAQALLENSPAFRRVLDDCDERLRSRVGWSLMDEIGLQERESRLHRTDIAQPILFALQVAQAAAWREHGVEPDAVVGHSAGEVAAAHVAGVLTLDDALDLIVARGRLMQRSAGQGGMALVALSPAQARERIRGFSGALEIAVENGPEEIVVSGDAQALAALEAQLTAEDRFCRPLGHDYPFHSALMEPLQGDMDRAVTGLVARTESLPIVSTVTGQPHGGHEWTGRYWAQQLRAPVRFAAAVETLLDAGHRHFVEISAHPVLCRSIERIMSGRGFTGVAVPSLRRDERNPSTFLRGLGTFHVHGHALDWQRLAPGPIRHLPWPTLPWQRQRYWLDMSAAGISEPDRQGRLHPFLAERLSLAHRPGEAVWQGLLDVDRLPYLLHHRVGGRVVFPAAGYLELVLAAVIDVHGPGTHGFTNVAFARPLVLSADDPRIVQVVIHSGDHDDAAHFQVASQGRSDRGSWVSHASGRVRAGQAADDAMAASDIAAIRARCLRGHSDSSAFYRAMDARGLQYGQAFRGVVSVSEGDAEALAEIRAVEDVIDGGERYHLHPALLDAGAQVVAALGGDDGRPFLPVGAATVRFHRRPGWHIWSHARRVESAAIRAPNERIADVRLFTPSGQPVADILGLRIRYLDEPSALSEPVALQQWLYGVAWRSAPARRSLPSLQKSTWVIFADATGVGEALAAALSARGQECLLVFPGQREEPAARGRFFVEPTSSEDLQALFAHLRTGGYPPCAGIVHLWSLDSRLSSGANDRTSLLAETQILAAEQLRNTTSVVHTLRQLVGQRWRDNPRLWLVTRGTRVVDGDQPMATGALPGAPLWGLGRTIAQEHPDMFGGLLDLDGTGAIADDVSAIQGELFRVDDESQVAVRGGRRHVARLVRQSVSAPRPFACRIDGSYLITGGLGALGLAVARKLIACGARRLVLVGRSPLPPRSTWAKIAPSERTWAKIAAIRELEALGASVHIASVDVGDGAELADFIDEFRSAGWPAIRGVVHLAGVLQDQILVRLDARMMAAVSRAKVLGAWLLHRLFQPDELDFMAMFSSIAATWGSAGQGNYAAANAFLDALAQHRHARGQPALSIAWGPWTDAGVAAGERRGHRLAARGIQGIAAAQGLSVFVQLLGQDACSITAADISWSHFARSYPTASASPMLEALLASEQESRLVEPAQAKRGEARDQVLAAPTERRHPMLVEMLTNHIARAVGRDPTSIDAHQPLTALGLDSLMGIELRNRLEAELDISIAMGVLLEGPPIVELARELLERLTEQKDSSRPARDLAVSSQVRITSLCAQGTRTGLFCIHPGGLEARGYAALAAGLGPEQPFHVLEHDALTAAYMQRTGQTSQPSGQQLPLGVLAAHYVEAIRGAQTDGPLLLCGWSLGGVLAAEIARLLQHTGHEVVLVALIDAPTPDVEPAAVDYDSPSLLRSFASYLLARAGRSEPLPAPDDMSSSSSDGFDWLLRWAIAARVLTAGSSLDQLRALFEIYREGLRRSVARLAPYRAQAIEQPLVYFRAREVLQAFADVFPDSARVWSHLTSGPFEAIEVPGDHYTMLQEPQVTSLCAALMRLIENRTRPSGR